jgi:hypothetical protein
MNLMRTSVLAGALLVGGSGLDVSSARAQVPGVATPAPATRYRDTRLRVTPRIGDSYYPLTQSGALAPALVMESTRDSGPLRRAAGVFPLLSDRAADHRLPRRGREGQRRALELDGRADLGHPCRRADGRRYPKDQAQVPVDEPLGGEHGCRNQRREDVEKTESGHRLALANFGSHLRW